MEIKKSINVSMVEGQGFSVDGKLAFDMPGLMSLVKESFIGSPVGEQKKRGRKPIAKNPAKKLPGRPKKHVIINDMPIIKKKPGRPAKNRSLAAIIKENKEVTAPKKHRGRPKKIVEPIIEPTLDSAIE